MKMWLKWLRFIPISYLASSTSLDRGKERELLTGLKSMEPKICIFIYKRFRGSLTGYIESGKGPIQRKGL